jgi:hypothetical protein
LLCYVLQYNRVLCIGVSCRVVSILYALSLLDAPLAAASAYV